MVLVQPQTHTLWSNKPNTFDTITGQHLNSKAHPPMRIGINGRFLVAKRTGVQRAAYNLLRTLVELDKDNTYVVFTGTQESDKQEWKLPNVELVISSWLGNNNVSNHFWEQFVLPRLATKARVDVLHSPANTAPFFYSGRSVVHIHDLCFVVNPQWYSFAFRTFYNFLIPRIARKATKVVTNSNNSKNDLLKFCNLPAHRVSMVYWAVDDQFVRSQIQQQSSKPAHLDPGLKGAPYILYVGSLEPRKNIKALLESYALFRERDPSKHPLKLVLIGGESPLFAEVRWNIRKFDADVHFKGFVSDNELKEYYRHATMVVYPSFYEGFGLPPLEAMASGTPVITSKTSSLPEVVGKAALLVDPNDHEELSRSIELLAQDRQLQTKLTQLGYEQVRKFNWYRVARSTLAVYYEVMQTQQVIPSGQVPGPRLPKHTWQRFSQAEQDWLEKTQPVQQNATLSE